MPFNYFGAKRRLADQYQPPRYGTIVEPFAGSAQYAIRWLAERSDLRAVLVDADPIVVASWRRWLDATPEQILDWSLEVGDPVRDYWHHAKGDGPVVPDSTRRANERSVERFHINRPAWARTRAAVGDRVEIHHGDYSAAGRHVDGPATWFIDPPYQHQGRRDYKHNSTRLDFRRLGEWCRTLDGQVIVCEAEPADWLPFRPLTASQALTGEQYVEVVWTNQPDDQLAMF